MAKSKAKLADFRTQRRNTNKHNPRGMGMLDNVIAKEGWIGAITTAANGETFAGSARLETAAARFGEDAEPIVIDSDGTRPIIVRRTDIKTADDPKAIRLGIADNRVHDINADYDIELLAEIADEVDISDMYADDELAAILNQDEKISGQKEEEDEEALERSLDNVGKVKSRVKLGEIWQLGRHKIACGDSTVEANVRALLGENIPDMVWSDPPYGKQFQSQGRIKKGSGNKQRFEHLENDDVILVDFIEQVKKYTKGWVCICTSWEKLEEWMQASRCLGKLKNLIVWDKGGGGLGDLSGSLATDYELIFAYGRNTDIKSKRIGSVWDIKKDAAINYEHPTQKPVELIERAFECFSDSDDLIFDPFLGSAPSIIAAQKMEGDRTVYGFELSPDYCEVIIQRYENFTGDIAKLVGTL